MKIKDILNGAATIAGIAFPPVGAAIKVVNQFLPDEKKLPETATGNDVKNAINNLPPEQQAMLYEQDIKLEITESNNFRDNFAAAMKADESGNSTRPEIAKLMAWQVFLTGMATIIGVVYAVCAGDSVMIDKISNSWAFMTAVLAVPAAILRAYFGLRTKEKQSRYAMASGHSPNEIEKGLLSRFLG